MSFPLRRAEAIRAARALRPPVKWRELADAFNMTLTGVVKAAEKGRQQRPESKNRPDV